MKKKIITYLFIFVGVLFAYRWFLYHGIRKNNQGIFNKYKELFLKNGKTYDILFIGSSRAEMHFNPSVFDSVTGHNSFNMGISGASLRINLAHLKVYCEQNKTPEFIVFNVDYFSLQNDTDRLSNFPRYFPYLKNRLLFDELQQMDHRFRSFYYNPLHSLPYTQIDYLSVSLHGWFNVPGKYDTLMYKGYQTAVNNNFHDTDSPVPARLYISQKNRNYLDSIIAFTKSRGIKLILVTSPVYGQGHLHATNKEMLVNELNQISRSRSIPYFNYTDSATYNNPLFYSDFLHLNRVGARQFSQSISFTFNNIYKRKALFNK